MGSTWTWAAFQSVVTLRRTCSHSRQHMVLNLSRERHTFDPRTSASATNKADYGLCKNKDCGRFNLFLLRRPTNDVYVVFQDKVYFLHNKTKEHFYKV